MRETMIKGGFLQFEKVTKVDRKDYQFKTLCKRVLKSDR